MIKFIKSFFGIEDTAKNILGKKSGGVEDFSNYKNWAVRNSAGTRDYN